MASKLPFIVTRKRLIREFAEEIASIQKRADYWYYDREDQEMSSYCLDILEGVRRLVYKLGISEEAYAVAKTIYDFSNSGRSARSEREKQLERKNDIHVAQ